MKRSKSLIGILIFALAVMTVPAFAQHGSLGSGVGLGGQARAGAGSTAGAGVHAGGVGVGARTNTDVQAKTSTQAPEARPGATTHSESRSEAHSGGGIATRIESNPGLTARVQALLPSGMSMTTAAAGFRNEGQFLAALHASHNLGIPFADLRAKMTGSHAMSLGAAIKASKPNMDNDEAREEAKKAEREVKAGASTKANASARAKAEASEKE
jgi:hypothetical protein